MPKKIEYTESKEIGKTSCPACPSSDGFTVYDDGHGYCFVCNHYEKEIGKEEDMPLDTQSSAWNLDVFMANTGDARGCQERKITKTVAEHYGIRVSYNDKREITAYHYPYFKDQSLTAFKTRTLPKQFSTVGDFKDVWPFGCQSFGMGGKRLVITEGEFDAMSVAQASLDHYNKIYPTISVASASNLKSLLYARDWIRSFEEVVLFFDNDAAGQKAIKEAANIIGIDKVKIASLGSVAKDPCELYIAAGTTGVMRAIWDAQPYSPAGIVVGHAPVWEEYLARQATESVPYPTCLQGINEKTKGMRFGEITLFTSGTGSGKSTVIKEIVLDLLDKTDYKVGMISLEESIGDTAEKFIQMKLKQNLQEYDVPLDIQEAASKEVFGSERLVLLDHQGSVGDESLIDKIEYMALMGCKYLILDHITIAVSEGAEGYSGNEAIDKVMSDLLKITKKHNIWLGVISHLRKVQGGGTTFEQGKLPSMDDIKGSGSIKQISFDIIGFSRDMANADEAIRNTIEFVVLKSRFSGKTGPAGSVKYNHATTRLEYNGTNGVDFEVLQ